MACQGNDGADAPLEAPAPLGPTLYETRDECVPDDVFCWAVTTYRQGRTIQAHAHRGGTYLFEAIGEMSPEVSAELDAALAAVDPSKTELIENGTCGASHPPITMTVHVDGVEYEIMKGCPPEGMLALDTQIEAIHAAVHNCNTYWESFTFEVCGFPP